MADLKELESALVKAHKAGAVDDAKVLAKAIKNKRSLSAPRRFAYGALEPIDAAAQMLYNALPESIQNAGDKLNNALVGLGVPLAKIPAGGFNQQLADFNAEYQAGKPSIDAARILGNIGSGIALTRKAPVGDTLGGVAKQGMKIGGVLGPLSPVYDPKADFWKEKAKQAGIGVASGLVAAPVGYGLSRMVSPKASANPDIKTLKDMNVSPTVGQTLGGWANRAEEKMQSMPIIGDAIMGRRVANKLDFNNAVINKAISSVGGKVKGAGYDAIGEAQKIVSKSYDDALVMLKGITLDKTSQSEMSSLNRLSKSLSKDMQKNYRRFMKDRIDPMLSPAKGMHAETYKKVDSELREKIVRFSKGTALEQELGGLYKELRDILHRQVMKSNPAAGRKLKNADKAFANMVRVEAAAKSSASSDGIFTPGQLLGGVRQADQSARKRAFSGGSSMMQDIGRAGQNVLGNKYPDSGTAGRMLLDGLALGTGFISPYYPAALLGGAGLYSAPAQKLMSSAITNRPGIADPISKLIRQSTPATTIPLTGLLQSLDR